jgi:hypothetical protein
VAVDKVAPGQRVAGAGRGGGRHGQGGRAAEAAPDRHLAADVDVEAVVASHVDGDAGGQVGGVPGQPRPLALAGHRQPFGRLHHHLDVQGQRQGQGVEARAEVGRRCGGDGAHGARP